MSVILHVGSKECPVVNPEHSDQLPLRKSFCGKITLEKSKVLNIRDPRRTIDDGIVQNL
jgi:hypothetical protein